MVRASCRTAAVFEAIIFGVDCSEGFQIFENSTLDCSYSIVSNWVRTGKPNPTAGTMDVFVCAPPRVVGVEKLGRNAKNQSHFLIVYDLSVCTFCIFQALDTLFAALHVSVIRILCSSYYILHISRHYIS
jgi:hypothetical protein